MLLLILLFILVPIAEIWVIIQVGSAIGAVATIGLLILDSLLGAWLLRHHGPRTWARFTETIAAGRMPTNEVADGAMVLFGGALMLTPGFLSDILGMLLLLPPTRALLRPALLRRVRITGTPRTPGSGAPRSWSGAAWTRRPPAYDVDGTVVEDDPGRGALPQ
jgi:UPF0716 protein FxsA